MTQLRTRGNAALQRSRSPATREIVKVMSLRILCIYTVGNYVDRDRPLDAAFYIPFGLAYVATSLQREGHRVRTLVLTPDSPLASPLGNVLQEFRPQLLCLTAVSTQFPLVKKVAESARHYDPNVYIALGGPHASLNPEDAMGCPPIDAICLGEGDRAIVQLAEQLEAGEEPGDIPNFRFRRRGSGRIEINALEPFHEDLDGLPFIDRAMWRPWILEPEVMPSVLLGRGCPNSCSYCSNHALKKLATGRYVRFRSPENVVAEIAQIARNPSVSEIHLEVETIGGNMKFAFDLCKALEAFNAARKDPVAFELNLALSSRLVTDEDLTEQLLAAFRKANITKLDVGLESGSPRIRNEVLRRPRYTNDQFIGFCRKAADHQVGIKTYVMIGLPSETLEDWRQTLDVLRHARPAQIQLGIFYPYPGTDIYDLARELGHTPDEKVDGARERKRVALGLPGFGRTRIATEYALCEFRVYKGTWSFARRAFSVVRALVGLYPDVGHVLYRFTRQTSLGRGLRGMIPSSWKGIAPLGNGDHTKPPAQGHLIE